MFVHRRAERPKPVVSFASRALAVVAALGFITACGDVDTYKVRTSPWEDTESLTNLEGRLVRLVRATTLCDSGESEELLSLVGSHTEFPGEDVATLKSSCSGANEANVSIDLDAKSIIYDFSDVAGSGMFASADFNGYVFETMARSCGEISSATVDRNRRDDVRQDRSGVHRRGLTLAPALTRTLALTPQLTL